MSIAFKLIRLLSPRVQSPAVCSCHVLNYRNYADKPKAPSTSKHLVPQNEERIRVRRARPTDVPRILRFVKEHARITWPNLTPNSSHNLILGDFVARTLAQGHSMLAEQQEAKRTWGTIRGLALSTSVCPWDATLLEKWARCVRCTKSRQLMMFTAHCLRAPGLHDKYNVHTVMQVVLMIPPDSPKSAEIALMLARNTLQRGRDTGFPLVRFDVTNESITKALSSLNLQKEWEFSYEVQPDAIKECVKETLKEDKGGVQSSEAKNHITVYTAFPLRK
ncbi:uncharacterized protein LOC123691744 [Colias croceus]|uniref:uncharacterized protein LOC123691744 n=1 Tax=Colias crocea TaxID=72248 RepID=UPI001E27ABC4|nr:uncharacterized protein LOC123691744 [Colias croceus]